MAKGVAGKYQARRQAEANGWQNTLDILEELDQILIFKDGVIESFDSFSEAYKESGELNLLIDPQND